MVIASLSVAIASDGFGAPPNTLTEPVWDTGKRDLARIVSNLKLVVFPYPNREDPSKALRDWDLWGPSFIVFLGLMLSWSASVRNVLFFAALLRRYLTSLPLLDLGASFASLCAQFRCM